MTLSIIIPVYNEEKTLEQALEQVFNVEVLGYNKEIIVVNDGSQDKSNEILNKLQNKHDFVYLKHNKNKGKGAALQTGLEKSTGDLVLIHDADLEYDPNNWKELLEKFKDPKTKVVYGSRNLKPKRKGYKRCAWGVKILTNLVNLLFKTQLTPSNNFAKGKISFAKRNCLTGLTDVYTCTKIFRSEVIKLLGLKSNNFDIEAEMTVKILKRKINIIELPINYYPRSYREGKKIKIWDGISGVWAIVKFAIEGK